MDGVRMVGATIVGVTMAGVGLVDENGWLVIAGSTFRAHVEGRGGGQPLRGGIT